ncbi:MAG: hypothetical protein GY719_00505 [bacterium]|nr:hypothetical protein [bacterium]
MSALWPTAAEAGSLRFLLPMGSLRGRYLAAGVLFFAGLTFWTLKPSWGLLALALVLLGHLPLWVRSQTTSPGGATPVHEEVWAPTEDGWMARVAELEKKGKAWDASPWDITSWRGFGLLVAIFAILGPMALVVGALLGLEDGMRFGIITAVLLIPVWFNGIRTTWNPSELRLKGEALDAARHSVESEIEGELDVVPLLALREGRRGKYPVDARVMLRPAEDDASGFLGVQVQVAINNVRGTDYPYLYCVVLGKEGFVLPESRGRHRRRGGSVEQVYERDRGEGVDFLVIRQHADNAGGWHTENADIREIVRTAVDEARLARRRNLKEGGG